MKKQVKKSLFFATIIALAFAAAPSAFAGSWSSVGGDMNVTAGFTGNGVAVAGGGLGASAFGVTLGGATSASFGGQVDTFAAGNGLGSGSSAISAGAVAQQDRGGSMTSSGVSVNTLVQSSGNINAATDAFGTTSAIANNWHH